jgi:hypothetical protein
MNEGMRTIDIRIEKARLTSVTVNFPEDALKLPSVLATIGLYSINGKRVATYALQTDHWEKNLKFDLPDQVLPVLGRIRDEIEQVVVAHCMGQFKQLPSGAEVVE